MSDPAWMSAVELVAAFERRELSPVEVAESALARIAALDPVVNGFVLVQDEHTLASAKKSEARWARHQPLGRLDGVPVAVKDIFLTAGWPTLRGSHTVDASGPWKVDAPAVAALRRHGAVLSGKTATPELGWKGVTDSPRHGATANPWDPERTAGGSSGGSATAVALGMSPLALGTDGGGSIRIPASFCGLVGIKPTQGRVPLWPVSPFGTLAHAGPLTRTVTDAALLLDVLSEHDPRDPTASAPPTERLTDRVGDGVSGLRIAYSPALHGVDVEDGITAAVDDAVRVLADLGAVVEQVDPAWHDPLEDFETLWYAGAAGATVGVDADLLDPGLAEIVEQGRRVALLDYLAAARRRGELGVATGTFHTDWDLLVTPTLPLSPFEVGREVPAGWPHRRWQSWTPFTYPFNLTGQPAATVPCGLTSEGLPIGLQLVGARHADAVVVRAARAYEQAAPFAHRPPLEAQA